MRTTTPVDRDEAVLRLKAADVKYRGAKLRAEQAIRDQVKALLQSHRDRRDILAFAAAQAGAPVARIAQDGLHTTNRSTAYEAIERGRALSSATDRGADA